MIRLPGQLDYGNKCTKYMYLPLLHKTTKTSELCRPVSIQHCQTPHLVFEHINLHTNVDKMNLFEATNNFKRLSKGNQYRENVAKVYAYKLFSVQK